MEGRRLLSHGPSVDTRPRCLSDHEHIVADAHIRDDIFYALRDSLGQVSLRRRPPRVDVVTLEPDDYDRRELSGPGRVAGPLPHSSR